MNTLGMTLDEVLELYPRLPDGYWGLQEFADALHKSVIELRAENARLRKQGKCLCGFDYQDEMCPQHGKTPAEWADQVRTLNDEARELRETVERVQAEFSDLRDLARSASSDSVTYGVSLSDLEDLFNLVAALGEGK